MQTNKTNTKTKTGVRGSYRTLGIEPIQPNKFVELVSAFVAQVWAVIVRSPRSFGAGGSVREVRVGGLQQQVENALFPTTSCYVQQTTTWETVVTHKTTTKKQKGHDVQCNACGYLPACQPEYRCISTPRTSLGLHEEHIGLSRDKPLTHVEVAALHGAGKGKTKKIVPAVYRINTT